MCLLVENLNLIERRKHVNNSHTQYWKSGVMWVLSLYKFSLQQHLDKHRQLGFVRLSIYRTFKNLSIGVAKSRLTSLISDYRHGLNHLSKQHIWLFGVWRRDCLEGDFRLQHASNKVRLSETRLEAAVGVWRMWYSFFPVRCSHNRKPMKKMTRIKKPHWRYNVWRCLSCSEPERVQALSEACRGF